MVEWWSELALPIADAVDEKHLRVQMPGEPAAEVPSEQGFLGRLNQLGSEGWEVVGFAEPGADMQTALLKRPKAEGNVW